MSERYTEEQYVEAFRKKMQRSAFTSDDSLDADPSVIVADSGAHVQVWLWISDDELEKMGFAPKPEEDDDDEGSEVYCKSCIHYDPYDEDMICTCKKSPRFRRVTEPLDYCDFHHEEE